jgi:hypothetical protein
MSMGCLILVGVLSGSFAEPQSAVQYLAAPDRKIEQRVLETVQNCMAGPRKYAATFPSPNPSIPLPDGSWWPRSKRISTME